jgi:hypothetical protein
MKQPHSPKMQVSMLFKREDGIHVAQQMLGELLAFAWRVLRNPGARIHSHELGITRLEHSLLKFITGIVRQLSVCLYGCVNVGETAPQLKMLEILI